MVFLRRKKENLSILELLLASQLIFSYQHSGRKTPALVVGASLWPVFWSFSSVDDAMILFLSLFFVCVIEIWSYDEHSVLFSGSGWKESFLFTVPIHECDWTSSQSSSATFSTEDDDQRRGVICDTIDIEDRQRRVVTGIVMSKFLKPTNKLAGRRQRRGRKPITQEKPVTPESDVLSQNTSFLCIIETFTYQMTTTLLELYQRKLVN